MEDLRIRNLTKSSRGTLDNPGKMVSQKSGLNKSILRQGWGIFRSLCENKTRKYGGVLVCVNPKNTSRKCSFCGHTEKENRLSQAEFSCKSCGYTENADRNAAKNILAIGLDSLGLIDHSNVAISLPLEAPNISTSVL